MIDNGIDVIVFGSSVKLHEGVTVDTLKKVFAEYSPGSSTNTAGAVKTAVDGYFARKAAGKAKPITLIVFTDGVPDDRTALKKVIVEAANKIDADEEIAISFIQVGKDEGARKFLKSLDDDLQGEGAKFDIVDTKDDAEMENMSVEDILLAAVND
jgi:Mg-chelatase subunit ChlD